MATFTLSAAISKFLKKLTLDGTEQGELRTLINAADHDATTAALAAKQATLVSGTNIKTIGGQSVLGSGNLTPAVIGAAPLVSPTFSGNPTVPPVAFGDSSSRIASTAFVQDAVSSAGGTFVPLVHNPNFYQMSIADASHPFVVLTATLSDGEYATYEGDNLGENDYLTRSGGAWELGTTTPDAGSWLSAATTDTPDLANWIGSAIAPGTGDPTIAPIVYPGAFTGQLCRVGDTAPYTWYSWNGTTWDDITTP